MHRIEVSPNCSLSLPAAATFFGTVAAASLFIALLFTVQGFWPVLPFAGVELLALGWALWASLRRGRQRDYVLLDEGRVVVEKVRVGGRERVEFPRGWAQVAVEKARFRHHPSRLLIRSHGRQCEIGEFLTERERRSLGRRLRQLLPAGGRGNPSAL